MPPRAPRKVDTLPHFHPECTRIQETRLLPLPTLTCVRPTAVTASTAQTRHPAGTGAALGSPPTPLLGRPALLQRLPRHWLCVPQAPCCALTSRSLSKARRIYRVRSQGHFPVCLRSYYHLSGRRREDEKKERKGGGRKEEWRKRMRWF